MTGTSGNVSQTTEVVINHVFLVIMGFYSFNTMSRWPKASVSLSCVGFSAMGKWWGYWLVLCTVQNALKGRRGGGGVPRVYPSLNSLAIDNLGEGAYESGWWCQERYKPQTGHAGIHGNPKSGNHHQAPDKVSGVILTHLNTHQGHQRGREGGGQTAAQSTIQCSKQLHNLTQQVCVI